ncbi:hypothetical protein UZ36_05840 [Candidatus Nitromaritima sp. SCGC AAA799-C22]|nr:hypothetical protein UZ36_05840 [Candidatus Nitromaritima sp. SCGC AAA799-C22]
MKIVLEHGGEFHGKKILVKRRLLGFGDDFFEVVRTFLAGTEKTPVYEDAVFWIPLENQTENIPVIEKKLQDELGVLDLKCFSPWKLGQVYFCRDGDAQGRVLLEGDGIEAQGI